MCLRRPITPPPHPPTHLPTCPPESGCDRVALMILTCLRSWLGRRPLQLRRVGGVGRQSCQRTFHSHAGQHASCTVANGTQGHSLYCSGARLSQGPGGGVGDSEFIVEEPQMCLGVLRCLHSEIFGTERPRNLLLICVGLSVGSRNCGSQSLFTSLYSRMQRPRHYLAGGCYQSAR